MLQEFHLQRDGTGVPSVKYIYAIRGDGSRASEVRTISDPAHSSTERILDFSSGKQMYTFSPQQLKTTTFDPAKYRAATWLRDAGSSCLSPGLTPSEKPNGEEVINGYRSVKLVNGEMTQWLALDYGCALVKDRAEWPDGQISEKRLVALIPGEPAPSLFDDPAGFQEVPPSRMFPLGPRASEVDAYYGAHRPPEATSRLQ